MRGTKGVSHSLSASGLPPLGNSRLPSLATQAFGSRRGQAGWQVGLPHYNAAVCPPSAWDVGHGLWKAKNRSCQLHIPVQAAESPPELKTAVHTVDPSIDSI